MVGETVSFKFREEKNIFSHLMLKSHCVYHNVLPSYHMSYCRVRFLLGGRHGEFKFLPPPGYAPCYEAVLPREKLKLEASQDQTAARDLLGPTVTLSQAAFTPTPVDTSQVQYRSQSGLSWVGGVLIYRDPKSYIFNK